MADKTEEELRAEAAPMLRECTVRLVRRGKRKKQRSEALSEEERQRLAEEEEAAREGEDLDEEREGDALEEERELEDGDEVREGDEEYVELAISSETEVERSDWWTGDRYVEVLGHGEGDIDLSYARDGLPDRKSVV